MEAIQRQLIRTDGTIIPLHEPQSIQQIEVLIGAKTLDVFYFRDDKGRLWSVMVDDIGHDKQLPVNDIATKKYWSVCLVGTVHQIRGDVFMQLDSEFNN